MHSRPTVSVFLGISLDGYIAGTGNELSWLEPYSTDPPEETGYAQLMQSIDTIVMGRNTFDVVSGFSPWPYSGKRMIILTHRPLVTNHPIETFSGSLIDLLASLEQQNVRHIYLDGGQTIREALEQDLVDNLTLSWIPMILGEGIPLFNRELPRSTWQPINSRQFPSGLVQARYTRQK